MTDNTTTEDEWTNLLGDVVKAGRASRAGVKDDYGKIRAGLVLGDFSKALEEVAKVGTFGARKYSPSGWKTVPDKEERYYDALWRHLLQDAYAKCDEESGLDHLSHAAWNILALIQSRYD